jgi:O-antigen/teichoic acid export membrane protein
MKALIHRMFANPAYAKLFEWAKLITISGLGQILVQVVSFISGIIIIRLLPTSEYAFYTLANVMLGTMAVLADGGIVDSVMSQGGKAWMDRNWLGAVMVTGLDLRKKFALGSLCVALPVLIYLLLHHGASLQMTILIVLSIIPSFFIELSSKILEIAPKLRQDIFPLQKNQVVLNLGRLAILGLTIFAFRFSFVAILAVAVPQVWYNIRLRQMSTKYANKDQPSNPVIRKSILKIVKRTMPGSIYYCFSGQITLWLISIFGSTENLAKVGALSRLAMVLNVFTVIFSTLVVPRFARLEANKNLLLTRFFQVQLSLLVIGIFITFAVLIFPSQVLYVFGKNYSSLTSEVVIITLGSCISMMAGITYTLSLSRGWVLHPSISITCNILTQLTLLYIFDLSKIQNVLWFSVITNIVAYVMLFIYYVYRTLNNPEIDS